MIGRTMQMILTLRTDKPEAEIGLFGEHKKINYETWQAHRQLAETIHPKIKEMLNRSNISLEDLDGVIFYKGPGSFTGLRIGASVANAMAYAQNIPIVAVSGDKWIETGIANLQKGKSDKVAIPDYGAPANISTPRK
jgi:tRNA threonylcarbamoyladenosine biosynthesis protein TsaB